MRIGIDLGGTNLRAGLVDRRGRVVDRLEVPTPDGGDPSAVIAEMARLVKSLGRVDAVGVGSPGLVDHERGIVSTSPNLPRWSQVRLKDRLQKATGRRVRVANDVNAMAWGEFLFGSGKGCRDILCITLGTGLGGGLILNGKLFVGKDHSAGEVGHAPLVRDGLPCPCGNRGCLEQYVAKSGIIRMAREARPDLSDVTPETVAKAAAKGQKWAIDVYDNVAASLALVLGGMIQILNLEKIVVGGQIANAGKILFGPLKRRTDSHVYPMLRKRYTVEKAALGGDGGIIGAAYL